MEITNALICSINSIHTYYVDDETKKRAKELVRELTSNEREDIVKIIKNVNTSLPNPGHLISKINSIQTLDTFGKFVPVSKKDLNYHPLEKILLNVWRAIKNHFGFRISDEKLLKKIASFSTICEKVDNIKAAALSFDNLVIINLEEELNSLKLDEEFNQEVFTLIEEYAIFGIDHNSSFDQLRFAYLNFLNNHTKSPEKIQKATLAFQTILEINELKNALTPDEPLTLQNAFNNRHNYTDIQKKKLSYLCYLFLKKVY